MRRAFSVAIFVGHPDEPKLLVILHRRLGCWLPVGGEMQPGETPLEAARREAFEETGLDLDFPVDPDAPEGTPPGYLGYEEHEAGSKGLHLNFVFAAQARNSAIRPNDEFDEHRWATVAEIEALSCPRNVKQFARLAQTLLTNRTNSAKT